MKRTGLRTMLGAIFGGLFGIGALGGLALIGASPNPLPGKPEGNWRLLDPVSYENITIFPVVSSSSEDTSAFLTLEEGLSSGEVIVSEQGAAGLARTRDGRPVIVPQYNAGASVNQLVLINRSKRPLLLLAGELVSGGKQDRIIGKDRIVPVGSEPLPLDVFCVEHGRWTGASSQFGAAKTIVHPSVREQAAVAQNQNEVWDAVRSGTLAKPRMAPSAVAGQSAAPPPPPPALSQEVIVDTIATAAPTQSYAKIYEQSRVGASVDDFVEELQRRFNRATLGLKGERVVGVVVAYGERRGMERHLRVGRIVRTLPEQIAAELCGRGSGAAGVPRNCGDYGCAGIFAELERAGSGGERARCLPVAGDYGGEAFVD